MRVAYVCADLGVPVFGSKGCSIHVQEIVRSFLRRGDQVELFATRTGGELPRGFDRNSVHILSPEPAQDTACRELAAQAVANRIRAAMATRGAFDLVYERYSLWSSAGPSFAHANRIPSILEINAPLVREQAIHRDLIDRDKAMEISQTAFDLAGRLVTVSQEVAQSIMADFSADDNKFNVIPNGVDTLRFSPDVPARLPSNQFTIGFVGSLKPWHGVETLLEAFQIMIKEYRTARLLIVGDGPMKQQLQDEFCAPDSDMAHKVFWIGNVASDEVPGYLTSMDVAVAPYPDIKDFYFSPLKVYEYMSSGVTAVASEIGQLKSIITNRIDGFLYHPCSVKSLAGILSFLAENATVRKEVGLRARRRAVEEFSWDQVLSRSLDAIGLGRHQHALEGLPESQGGLCN